MNKICTYTLLMALISMVGCSECDISDSNSELSNEICFVDNNNSITRAANDNSDDFCVWALANESGSRTWYFVDIFSSETPEDDTAYFWPKGDVTLDFWAFSASSASSFMQSVSDKQSITASDVDNIDLKYSVPAGAQDDLTMATPLKGCTDETSNMVYLTFNHLLSKVIVSVRLADNLKRQYALDSDFVTTLDVKYNSAVIHTSNPSATLGAERGVEAAYPTQYSGAESYFIIPQMTSNVSLTLSDLKITDRYNQKYYEGDAGRYVIADGTVEGNNMKSGNAYLFQIVISDITVDDDDKLIFNKILLDARLVDWRYEENEFEQEY